MFGASGIREAPYDLAGIVDPTSTCPPRVGDVYLSKRVRTRPCASLAEYIATAWDEHRDQKEHWEDNQPRSGGTGNQPVPTVKHSSGPADWVHKPSRPYQ